jgi:hypothetical protein
VSLWVLLRSIEDLRFAFIDKIVNVYHTLVLA